MSRTSILMSAVMFGSAACLMIPLATPAVAEEVIVKHQIIDPSIPRVLVRFNDLNLNDQDGRDRLTMRLDAAVRTVCGNADARVLDEFSAMMNCREQSTERAYAARDAVFAQHMAARDQGQMVATSAAYQTLAVFAQR